jgi:hypothetical protein
VTDKIAAAGSDLRGVATLHPFPLPRFRAMMGYGNEITSHHGERDMADESWFQKGLDANSSDLGLRRVFADWLEEYGRLDEAYAQRWMAQERKRPRFYSRYQEWVWYDEAAMTKSIDPESNLPTAVWRMLPRPPKDPGRKVYATRREAEASLTQALVSHRGSPI